MKRNTFSLLISFQPEKVSAIQSPQETVCSRPLRQRQSRHSFQIRLVLNNSFKTCTAFQASETPTGTLRLHPLTLTAPSPAPTSPRLRPLPHSRHHTPLAPPPSCYIPSCHSHPPPPHSSVLFHILVTIPAGTRPRRWQSAGLSENLRSLLRLQCSVYFPLEPQTPAAKDGANKRPERFSLQPINTHESYAFPRLLEPYS